MAERLTMTYFDDVTTYDPIDVQNNKYSEINFQKVLKKLAQYEDLEEQCIKETTFPLRLILDKFIEFQNDIEELIRYRELEEWGRLIELPCAVGDTVYEVQKIRKRIQEYTIISIHYSHISTLIGWKIKDGKGIYSNLHGFEVSAIGKTVFLTKEEAEAKLKERGEQE